MTTSSNLDQKEGTVEGLLDASELESRNRLDDVIRKLQAQLPRTLMEPLTSLSTDQVYDPDFQLSVLVPTSNKNSPKISPDGHRKESRSNADTNDQSVKSSQIPLVTSREELISLSDVLVLAITAAKQAQSMLSLPRRRVSGSNETNATPSSSVAAVECQLVIDPKLNRLRVPWKTKVPLLLSASPILGGSQRNPEDSRDNNFVQLEGLSDFVLSNTTGKIMSHQVVQVFLNGRSINGPEVGQALEAIQSASKNLQQSPFFLPNVFGGGSNDNTRNSNDLFWKEMRDGILEQVATAASASSRNDKTILPVPPVVVVNSIETVKGWVSTEPFNLTITSQDTPLPGTDEWNEYITAHESLTEFCNQVIPMLAGTTTGKSKSSPLSPILVDESVFASNVTFKGIDGSTLMKGRGLVGNFYQSLSLARKMGTGQDWTVTKCCVLDWRKRTIAIDYKATNSIPPRWKIQGRDMYVLSSSSSSSSSHEGDTQSRAVIQEIQQLDFQASAADGNLFLDSSWLMKNLVRAVEQGRNVANGGSDGNGMVNFGEVISEILLQQGGNLGLGGGLLRSQQSNGETDLKSKSMSKSMSKSNKFSEKAGANAYYLMASLLEQYQGLFDDTTTDRRTVTPGAEFMGENVELQGYLGEPLVRGRNIYNRVLGTLLARTRQAIVQKQLSIVSNMKKSPPKVELIAFDTVRLYLSYSFRLAAPRLLPEIPLPNQNGATAFGSGSSLPLKIELVSDYKLDPNSGQVTVHKLVETKVNGQLTPGDMLSRWIQRFLKLDSGSVGTSNGASDEFFQTFVDAVSWFRTFRPPDR
ncbi:unnamed protein product [Cylindrotheca closterium]|uniref:Uncharacterized protein n=1 Tax=Cylindrotheca closterium TaxID=2856 RepID=A0AAD2FSU3_9STRA|nr:unnamed protein product [Cylindrotheca closterium]